MNTKNWSSLPSSFYQRADVEQVAQELLGKILITDFDGRLTAGRIAETEAYSGLNDKACHANNGRRTARTEVMYMHGGVAYVYLCYGIHHLFNVVTNVKDSADAVLIRAIEPLLGVDVMLERRKMLKPKYALCSGPGSMSKALGITFKMTGTSLLNESEIWIVDDGFEVMNDKIIKTTRIGVDYAGEDALLLRRYLLADNLWVSKRIPKL